MTLHLVTESVHGPHFRSAGSKGYRTIYAHIIYLFLRPLCRRSVVLMSIITTRQSGLDVPILWAVLVKR